MDTGVPPGIVAMETGVPVVTVAMETGVDIAMETGTSVAPFTTCCLVLVIVTAGTAKAVTLVGPE